MNTHLPTPTDSPIRVHSTPFPDRGLLPAVAVFNPTGENGYWIVQSERDARREAFFSDAIAGWSRLTEEAHDDGQ